MSPHRPRETARTELPRTDAVVYAPSMKDLRARTWFAATAVLVFFAIVVQVVLSANATAGHFPTAAGRVFNVFCFFTVQSNLIVAATSLLLAIDPRRTSTVFRVFRLTGIVAITVTGIVFHAVLRALLDLEGWALVVDNVLHTAVPIMAVAGWLVFGPRGQTSSRVARLAVLFPVAWMAFALIRGEIVDYYPYPFIDVGRIGYARVAVNAVWVALLYLGMAFGYAALDGWLTRLRAATGSGDADPRIEPAMRA